MRLAKAFLLVLLLLLVGSLISEPVAYAEEAKDTLWIEALKDALPVDSVPVGVPFRMSVNVSNLDSVLAWMKVSLSFQDTGLVRLDYFSFAGAACRLRDPDTLDYRDTTRLSPDAIYVEFSDTGEVRNYLAPGRGNIIDLWFTGIRTGDFFIDTIGSITFYDQHGLSVDSTFLTDSVALISHSDPGDRDSLWIKKGVDQDTVGIKAKFPLPFTACNDEILSGFEIPFLMVGNNLPTFLDSFCFNDTRLTDTNVLRDVDILSSDSVLVRLELKKGLQDTVLEPGDQNKLFNLWLRAADSAGTCDIYTDFVPHTSNLFFIDSVGGFTPTSSGIACTTFSYVPGDITHNNVANNVDLFYLAMHLFLPPNDTSSGESSYDPEDLDRIKSQRLFQSTPISSEEWDSTFSEILFRGDVNADSRVDVGDFYAMSRFFQADPSEGLKYGWSDPKSLGLSDYDTVRMNFRKAYPGQDITILIEIYNEDSLGAITIPLQIPDPSKLECYSIIPVGRFEELIFDWEWMTWDEDYDQNPDNQDILIAVSTLGTGRFPHIPKSTSGYAEPAFALLCTVKDTLLGISYIDSTSLLSSHRITFFDKVTGYGCIPQVEKSMVDMVFADYGDAPDGTNLCYAGYSFPTLCNTNFARIPGRSGPFHRNATEWLGTSADSFPVTKEETALIKDRDQDNLSEILYIDGGTAWYAAPVTVSTAPDTFLRYLNVLYDINGDSTWKDEWVVRNKLVKPPDTTTERIALGPFTINHSPDSIPAWARFTLTREPISPQLFEDVGGWDGSLPDTGWDYGETEDILFGAQMSIDSLRGFQVELDPSYIVPEGGKQVEVTVEFEGNPPDEKTVTDLSLSWEVFDSTGEGNTTVCSFDESRPPGSNPDSFDVGKAPDGHPITFRYEVSFPSGGSNRINHLLWKVTKELEDGTRLVATDEAEFIESSAPYFVFLDAFGNTISSDDTITISSYGGVVDFRLLVFDLDETYPIRVFYDRDVFQGSGVVYPPVFGSASDLTKVFDDTTSDLDSVVMDNANDTLIFHWAPDIAEIGYHTAVFTAKEMVGAHRTTYDTLVIRTDALLPDEDKVWVGRTGVLGSKNESFRVPVEVYNTKTLEAIRLPFKISTIYGDHIDFLIDTSFTSSRLEDSTILGDREIEGNPSIPIPEPENLTIRLVNDPYNPGYLSPGFGKIFDLIFKGNMTCFKIDKRDSITFLDSSNSETIYPAFESYEIRVVEKEGAWTCGDANSDSLGEVTIADVAFLTNYVLKNGPPPDPVERGDVDCLGGKEPKMEDIVYLVNYLFRGGDTPKQCDYGCTLPPPAAVR